MAVFDRILVPIDFSPCSDAALERAVRLRDALGAHLEVLHVWASPEVSMIDPGLMVGIPGGDKMTLTHYVHRQAQRMLDEKLAELDQKGVRNVIGRLVEGDPAHAIVEASRNADLVVMGTHGRRALAHMFLGSVAERVVRRAHCAVLTTRSIPRTEGPRTEEKQP